MQHVKTHSFKIFNLFFFFFLAITSQAQSTGDLVINQSGNTCEVSIANMPFNGFSDIIYYRFSDGFHKKVKTSASNPTAAYSRTFATEGTYTVVAYIAKKRGSLSMANPPANPTINVVDCPECNEPHVAIAPGNTIRITSSWRPFVNPQVVANSFSDYAAIHEDAIAMVSPINEPWFFLNVTIEPSKGQSHNTDNRVVEITIPSVYEVEGIISKEQWRDFSSTSSISFDNSLCSTATLNPDGLSVNVNFEAVNKQGNFYVLLKGTPELYEELTFTAELKDAGVSIGTSMMNTIAVKDPHDPNQIIANEDYVCLDNKEEPASYHVDFQNYGEGYAQSVVVHVSMNKEIVDETSLLNYTIESSHPISSIYMEEKEVDYEITFVMAQIYLPGTEQTYPRPFYLEEETRGWIDFKLSTHECFDKLEFYQNGIDNTLEISGAIDFYAVDGTHLGELVETTPMNTIEQDLLNCYNRAPCVNENSSDKIVFENDLTFSAVIYPTILREKLTIDLETPDEINPVEIMLFDLTGRPWINTYRMPQGQNIEQIKIRTDELPAGFYILRIEQGDELFKQKLIKQ